ncbi:heat shock protein DnaJ domain-containing protein [Halovivax asiaticus JCM 14624]|uniref:Heat shock protein DnaJ domain-containing protein n=1 Tax=Halovivax asiaticus JCM 14624 TaxID=1227490 RepID=M0BRK2_9EURY|nr:J domain-containing protein [Halovivax asiaticus]ELZ13636.1 heat shock protein DnaJ domain-containing protein [Halovivax asiaticus JCM 14624]
MERPYEVLGLSSDASLATVRQRYRALLTEHHPDQGGCREQFLELKAAYESITGEQPPDHSTSQTMAVDTRSPDAPTFEIEAESSPTRPLSVTGDLLALALVGFDEAVDISRLVETPGTRPALERAVAAFEVRNTTSQPRQWRGPSQTRFIGTDGFMYEASTLLTPGRTSLPETWWPGSAVLEPGTGVRAIVVANQLPASVTVDRVVYTQHGSTGGEPTTERYRFDLTREARKRLDHLPFELEAE